MHKAAGMKILDSGPRPRHFLPPAWNFHYLPLMPKIFIILVQNREKYRKSEFHHGKERKGRIFDVFQAILIRFGGFHACLFWFASFFVKNKKST